MKIIEKLKPLLLLHRNKKSEHYKNLQDGEKIEIDGKKYVKIKFKLVDSLDIDTAKMIDNLETENKLLNKHNQELQAKLENLGNKVSLFEQLNYNLINTNKQKIARTISMHQKEVAILRKKAKRSKKEIRKLINQNTKLKEILEEEKLKVIENTN